MAVALQYQILNISFQSIKLTVNRPSFYAVRILYYCQLLADILSPQTKRWTYLDQMHLNDNRKLSKLNFNC